MEWRVTMLVSSTLSSVSGQLASLVATPSHSCSNIFLAGSTSLTWPCRPSPRTGAPPTFLSCLSRAQIGLHYTSTPGAHGMVLKQNKNLDFLHSLSSPEQIILHLWSCQHMYVVLCCCNNDLYLASKDSHWPASFFSASSDWWLTDQEALSFKTVSVSSSSLSAVLESAFPLTFISWAKLTKL